MDEMVDEPEKLEESGEEKKISGVGDNNQGKVEVNQVEGKEVIVGEKKEKVVLSVVYDVKTGSIGVSGPGDGQLYDEPMCFWLLEKGKDFVKGHNAMKRQPKIISGGQGGGFGSSFLRGLRRRR